MCPLYAPVVGLTVRAALGSLVFLVLVPGTMGGLIPWWITEWQAQPVSLTVQIAGFGLLAAGLAVLLEAFVRFVFEGMGTPAPIAPTEQLVVGGVYRHVRNPMYVAVTAVIIGQALLLGRGELGWYALAFWALTASFVRLYEEPTLGRRYGDQYRTYRDNVPAWLPRLRPWRG
jgi:protein-S-isoprenylcysteine O-methyltransferase Ste14